MQDIMIRDSVLTLQISIKLETKPNLSAIYRSVSNRLSLQDRIH